MMSSALPDVSVTDLAPSLSPLQWVGMQGIDLPVRIQEATYQRELHARADVQVDLPAPHVKGIHMSRLYRLLDAWGQAAAVSPPWPPLSARGCSPAMKSNRLKLAIGLLLLVAIFGGDLIAAFSASRGATTEGG